MRSRIVLLLMAALFMPRLLHAQKPQTGFTEFPSGLCQHCYPDPNEPAITCVTEDSEGEFRIGGSIAPGQTWVSHVLRKCDGANTSFYARVTVKGKIPDTLQVRLLIGDGTRLDAVPWNGSIVAAKFYFTSLPSFIINGTIYGFGTGLTVPLGDYRVEITNQGRQTIKGISGSWGVMSGWWFRRVPWFPPAYRYAVWAETPPLDVDGIPDYEAVCWPLWDSCQ